jgi:hypothetical protein
VYSPSEEIIQKSCAKDEYQCMSPIGGALISISGREFSKYACISLNALFSILASDQHGSYCCLQE